MTKNNQTILQNKKQFLCFDKIKQEFQQNRKQTF